MRAAPDSSKCVSAEGAAVEGLGAGLEGEGMGGVYNKMARGVLFWIVGGRGEGRSSASRDAFPSSLPVKQSLGKKEKQTTHARHPRPPAEPSANLRA